MLRRLCSRLTYANIVATLALFFALAGGTAVALDGSNTVFGDDITDNQVSSADVRDDNLGFGGLAHQDLGPGSVRSSEVSDGSLTGADIAYGALNSSHIGDNTIDGDHVRPDALGGSDINESSLDLPTTTATFAGRGNVPLPSNGSMGPIITRLLPGGNYTIAATANVLAPTWISASRDTVCELRNHTGAFIGGSRDRRFIPENQQSTISLSMNGGVQIPAGGGGGEVGVYCRHEQPFFGLS